MESVALLVLALILLAIWMFVLFYKLNYTDVNYWRRREQMHWWLQLGYAGMALLYVIRIIMGSDNPIIWLLVINVLIFGGTAVFHHFLNRDARRRIAILTERI